MAVTVAQMRTAAQRLADMTDGTFVSNAEWLDYLNEGGSELHDMIVKADEDYFVTKGPDVALANGASQFSVPADVYKLRGIDLRISGETYSLRRFNFAHRNLYQDYLSQYATGIDFYRYNWIGETVQLLPHLQGSAVANVWYVPRFVEFTTDLDGLPSIYPRGWERYIIVYAAKKALTKEQSDTSQLINDLADHRAMIETILGDRDQGEAETIADTRYSHRRFPNWGT